MRNCPQAVLFTAAATFIGRRLTCNPSCPDGIDPMINACSPYSVSHSSTRPPSIQWSSASSASLLREERLEDPAKLLSTGISGHTDHGAGLLRFKRPANHTKSLFY